MTSLPETCLNTKVSPPALFMMSFTAVEVSVTPAALAVMVCEPFLLSNVLATVCPDASIASCRAEYACPVMSKVSTSLLLSACRVVSAVNAPFDP